MIRRPPRSTRTDTLFPYTTLFRSAEEMADRVGVISKGKLILVEEKQALFKKLGRKTLTLNLADPLDAVPADLAQWTLELAAEGYELVYEFDRSEEHTSELQSLMRISYAVFCLKKKKHNHRFSLFFFF